MHAPFPVGRLAPSPTGYLHVGHARSFLLAWWSVRSRGGRVVLRVEDLDASRSRPEFVAGILRDLEWLGLDWDGAWRLQSQGRERFEAALTELERRGHVFACTCSRADVLRALSAPHEARAEATGEPCGSKPAELRRLPDGEARYPGTCRGRWGSRAAAEAQTGASAALRFATPSAPGSSSVVFDDGLRGRCELDPRRELDDFVVARRDGGPSYQLAVVVDDAFDGVDEVLRGDDLLLSAGRQWLLQQALGLPHPRWVHVPLVVDDAGTRLAKRSAGLSLAELRADGVDPRTLVAWVARSAGQDAPERLAASELTRTFELARVPLVPVQFGQRERQELSR